MRIWTSSTEAAYLYSAGESAEDIANGIADLINSDPVFQARGISASVIGTRIYLVNARVESLESTEEVQLLLNAPDPDPPILVPALASGDSYLPVLVLISLIAMTGFWSWRRAL